MELRPEEITKIIRAQIKNYEARLEQSETGVVILVGDGIAKASGLEQCMAGELVEFPNGAFGMAQNLEEDTVSIVILGNDSGIKEGDIVKRTGKVVSVPVGAGLIGRVVNALGEPIDGKGVIENEGFRPIEMPAPGIIDRQHVSRPLQTGIKAIDSMIPIGRGQRELIIGDRQTGKTTIATDTILNQKGKNVICIYVAIGQKRSTVASIVNNLTLGGAMDYTIVVSATASELAPMQYIAPYTGCTMGEHFMMQGKDVLVLLTDMTNFADAMKEIAITQEQVPSNRGYPGDLYSQLASRYEKAVDFDDAGSVTILAVTTMPGDDVTHPVPDNTGYITEGQFYLKGGRIEPFGSLSRLKQNVNGKTRDDHRALMDGMIRLYSSYKDTLEKKSMGFMMSEWDEKLLKYGEMFEKEMMDLSVNIPLEGALDKGWVILAACFKSEETGLKSELIAQYWPKS